MIRLIRVTNIRRVPVYVHWSVFALCFFFLGAGIDRIFTALAGMSSYLAMLLVHEFGHHYVAVRRRYTVDRVEVFPLHALCRIEDPDTKNDAAAIAWGGPLAQLLLAFPIVAYIVVFGYTPLQPLNAALAMLGFFSPAIAVFNLLPVAPLDGKAAWSGLTFRLPRFRKRREQTPLEFFEEAARKAREKAGRK